MFKTLIAMSLAAFTTSAFAADCSTDLAAKPFLYRVENADASFLVLGLRHIGVKLAQYPPIVTEVIDTADQVILETKKEMGLWLKFKSVLAAHRGDAPPLSELLTRDEFNRLAAMTDIDRKILDYMSVFGATIMILGNSPAIGYEKGQQSLSDTIRQRAKVGRKRILGLAKNADQLEKMKRTFDLDMLKTSIAKSEFRREEERGDFFAGRSEALETEMNKMKRENPRAWKVAIGDSNHAWVRRIEDAIHRGGRTLVAVGAGHLFGDQGLLDLFEDRGYTITRIED